MKKVIVTGGLGYIGSHLTVQLIKNGYMVLVVDNCANSTEKIRNTITSNLSSDEKENIRFFIFDINNQSYFSDIVDVYKPIDCVFHIAALKSVDDSVKNPYKYYNTNVAGTLSVLRCMKQFDIKKLVFASSASVYGNLNITDGEFIDEEYPLNPISPYGKSKVMCEDIIKDVCNADKTFKCVSLRYFNPGGASLKYNIGEETPQPQNIVPILINKLSTDKPFKVFGTDYKTQDGTAVRDYLHIDDLVDSHILSLKWLYQQSNDDNSNKNYLVLNIGSGKAVTVTQLVECMENVTGKKIQIVYCPRRLGDVTRLLANPNRAKKMIGFECKYVLSDICKSAYDYESRKSPQNKH